MIEVPLLHGVDQLSSTLKVYQSRGRVLPGVLSMRNLIRAIGNRGTLASRLNNILISCAVIGSFAAGAIVLASGTAFAGGETRTISMYHNRTRESLTVVYMKDGKYVPSAMKQINYLLRDWRRNEVITIDPRTIDLVWELHKDLGSIQPIKIVCGYRSGKTNALLRRIGRKVAEKSQHIRGKAIDFYFSDVPTIKVRNGALARRFGGVGYYTGPSGFLHVDSGNVRQWGPAISSTLMAQILSQGAKTMGRHLGDNSANQLADNADHPSAPQNGGLLAMIQKLNIKKQVAPTKLAPVEKTYDGDTQDLADLSADAAVESVKTSSKLPPKPITASNVNADQMAMLSNLTKSAANAPKSKQTFVARISTADKITEQVAVEPAINHGFSVPKPRLMPVESVSQAAVHIKSHTKFIRVEAANAPPPSQTAQAGQSPLDHSSLSTLVEDVAQQDEPEVKIQTPNSRGKSNFAADIRNGTTNDAPLIKPLLASAGRGDINWWPQIFLNTNATIRRDGAPPVIGSSGDSLLPNAITLQAEAESVWTNQQPAEGKGDLLVVNREGKGNLYLGNVKLSKKMQKVVQLTTP